MLEVLNPWAVAQREVETACDLLTDPSPPNLDRCATCLAIAAARLAEGPPPEPYAQALRGAVKRIRRLLENAARYQREWQTILLGMTAPGYTAEGGPAALHGPMRLLVDG